MYQRSVRWELTALPDMNEDSNLAVPLRVVGGSEVAYE